MGMMLSRAENPPSFVPGMEGKQVWLGDFLLQGQIWAEVKQLGPLKVGVQPGRHNTHSARVWVGKELRIAVMEGLKRRRERVLRLVS